MKINFSAIICLGITLMFASCGNEQPGKGTSIDSAATAMEYAKAANGVRKILDFDMDLAVFPDYIDISTAKTTIDNYYNSAITCTTGILPGSIFHCTASELKAFIDGFNTDIKDLHLFLSHNKRDDA